ncbi:basic amino acid ABC transporter substrate-binding protein [Chloroflexota bacterium]
MKRFLLLVIVGLMAVSLVLTSCSQKANRVLVVTDATYSPFEYVDEETGEIIGFDIDLMKAIAEKENFEIEFMDIRFESLLEDMAQGKYDAAIAAISITEERKKDMLFSDPYFVAGHVITVSKDNTTITGKDSLKGKTVGVKSGTTGAIEVSEMHDVNVKPYADYEEPFQALMDGKIDAVVSDNIFALNYVSENPDKLRIAGEPFTQEYYGIAVAKNKTELLAKINAGLKAVKSEGLIEELSQKWLPQ